MVAKNLNKASYTQASPVYSQMGYIGTGLALYKNQTYQVSRISRETPAFWTPSPTHPPHRQNLPHFINKASFHLIKLHK